MPEEERTAEKRTAPGVWPGPNGYAQYAQLSGAVVETAVMDGKPHSSEKWDVGEEDLARAIWRGRIMALELQLLRAQQFFNACDYLGWRTITTPK